MKLKTLTSAVLIAVFITSTLVLFQNCGRGFHKRGTSASSSNQSSDPTHPADEYVSTLAWGPAGNYSCVTNASDRAALQDLINLCPNQTCEYLQVSCNAEGRIEGISDWTIINYGSTVTDALSGSIPSSIGNLTDLIELDLRQNKLTGPLPPELGLLSKLRTLMLSNNPLNAVLISELGNLNNLKYLNLTNCQLKGSLPAEIGNLNNLESFSVWNNQLSGPLPTQIFSLGNLKYFDVGYNNLSGHLPNEIGNLANLQFLYLNKNSFEGDLPQALNSFRSF